MDTGVQSGNCTGVSVPISEAPFSREAAQRGPNCGNRGTNEDIGDTPLGLAPQALGGKQVVVADAKQIAEAVGDKGFAVDHAVDRFSRALPALSDLGRGMKPAGLGRAALVPSHRLASLG